MELNQKVLKETSMVGGLPDPQTFGEVLEMAKLLSSSTIIPKAYQGKPGDIAAAYLMGKELGMKMMQALRGIVVIKGNATLQVSAMKAICAAHPDFEDIILDDDGETATCTVKRRGRSPITRTFSNADARQAGLLNKDNWVLYPQYMRSARATSWALRDAFPDALNGIYAVEELQDAPQPVEAKVVAAEAAETQAAVTAKGAEGVKARIAAAKQPETQETPKDAEVVAAEAAETADDTTAAYWITQLDAAETATEAYEVAQQIAATLDGAELEKAKAHYWEVAEKFAE